MLNKESGTHLRRQFLGGVTAVLGVAATSGVLSAQSGGSTQTPSPANDLNILNYALTLELLEATFYTQGLARFSSTEFNQSEASRALVTASGLGASDMPLSGEVGTGLAQNLYSYLSLIRDHEQAHVRTLTAVIRRLGGTPVTAPRFQFPYENADQFIALAAVLENTGVSAYNGAIPMISSAALVTASATIATVEARHAAYLNRVRGMVPFPDAFDAGKSMAEILEAIKPFLAA